MKKAYEKPRYIAVSVLLIILIACLSAICFVSCQNDEPQPQPTPTPDPTPDTTYSVKFAGVYGDYRLYSEEISFKADDNKTFTPREIVGYEFDKFDGAVTQTDKGSVALTKDLDKKEITVNYKPLFLSLPVVWINTENDAEIADTDNYVSCAVSVKNTQDSLLMNEVYAGIRGCGNTTWNADTYKKPYRIKFDEKQSVLGSEYKAKSWTLIANHFDRSLSRNALAYTLADEFDDIVFSSARHFVELYLNGEYMGVYNLCDQIQTGAGRVDVDETLDGNGNTGYLVELGAAEMYDLKDGESADDTFRIGEFVYELKTPDSDDALYNADIYVTYIKNYITNCLTALNGSDYGAVTNLLDVKSFADAYIVHELFANVDVGRHGFYIYKDKDGKLCCGPLWDFDISAGNMNYGPGNTSFCPSTGYLWASENNCWYAGLLRFDEFTDLIKTKLIGYEQTVRKVINLAKTDNPQGYYLSYKDCFERNFEKDKILGTRFWPSPLDVDSFTTVELQLTYLRNWLSARYDYLLEYYNNAERPSKEFNYLAIGNSLTVHGKNEYWFNEIGMAASTADKDYFHLVSADIKQRYKNANCTAVSYTAWELQAEHRNQTYNIIEPYLNANLNLVTIQLSENAQDISTLEEDYYDLIKYIRQKCPDAQIIIVDDFWSDIKSNIEQKVAATSHLTFASLAEIRGKEEYKCVIGSVVYDDEGNPHTVTHPGVAEHPNDAGMAYIAKAIIKLINY